MSHWPQHQQTCSECTGSSATFAYGAGGACSRCYRLKRQIKALKGKNWLETISKLIPVNELTCDQIGNGRNEIIRQWELRLASLKVREQARRLELPFEPLDIEEKFAQVAKLVRKKYLYPHNANYLRENFTSGQMRILYQLLDEIVEQAVPRPVNAFGKIYSR